MSEPCEHYAGLGRVTPASGSCEACVALGEHWTDLRVCLTCGHVGCCEDSKHAHALAHFQATGHPVIASHDPKEKWSWCYVHHRYFDLPAGLRPERRSFLASLFRRGTRAP
jgi:uncharacterized UBP type Zn finger protein